MDFLAEQDIRDLLSELGVTAVAEGEECVFLEMAPDHAGVKHCLDNESCLPCGSDETTTCIDMEPPAMVESVVQAIHRIH